METILFARATAFGRQAISAIAQNVRVRIEFPATLPACLQALGREWFTVFDTADGHTGFIGIGASAIEALSIDDVIVRLNRKHPKWNEPRIQATAARIVQEGLRKPRLSARVKTAADLTLHDIRIFFHRLSSNSDIDVVQLEKHAPVEVIDKHMIVEANEVSEGFLIAFPLDTLVRIRKA